MTVSTLHWMLSRVGLSWLCPEGLAYGDTVFVYEKSPTVDKAFGLHAFFGMLWLLCAYLQMGPIVYRSKKWHRVFGSFALAAFMGHIFASLNNLLVDEAKHHPFAKMMLLSPVVMSVTYFTRSMMFIKNGDKENHIDNAIIGFLYSIEGAGQIREVALWQLVLKPWIPEQFQGPLDCQGLAGGRATHCVSTYCTRMLFVRLFTVMWVGIFARTKNNPTFTKKFVHELAFTIVSILIQLLLVAEPSFVNWINSAPTFCWTLALTYFMLMMAFYMVPLFQLSGQPMVRASSRSLACASSSSAIESAPGRTPITISSAYCRSSSTTASLSCRTPMSCGSSCRASARTPISCGTSRRGSARSAKHRLS